MAFTFKDSYKTTYLGMQQGLMDQLLVLSEKEAAQQAEVIAARRKAAIDEMDRINNRIADIRDDIDKNIHENAVSAAKFELDIQKANQGKVSSRTTRSVGPGGGTGAGQEDRLPHPQAGVHSRLDEGASVIQQVTDNLLSGDFQTIDETLAATGADRYFQRTKEMDNEGILNANAGAVIVKIKQLQQRGQITDAEAIRASQNWIGYLTEDVKNPARAGLYTQDSIMDYVDGVPVDLNPRNPTGDARAKWSISKTDSYEGPSVRVDVEYPDYDPSRKQAELEELFEQRAGVESTLANLGTPGDPMQMMAEKFRRYAPINEPLAGRAASPFSRRLSKGFAQALADARANRPSSERFAGTALENIGEQNLRVDLSDPDAEQQIDAIVASVPVDQQAEVSAAIIANSARPPVDAELAAQNAYEDGPAQEVDSSESPGGQPMTAAQVNPYASVSTMRGEMYPEPESPYPGIEQQEDALGYLPGETLLDKLSRKTFNPALYNLGTGIRDAGAEAVRLNQQYSVSPKATLAYENPPFETPDYAGMARSVGSSIGDFVNRANIIGAERAAAARAAEAAEADRLLLERLGESVPVTIPLNPDLEYKQSFYQE